MRKPNPLQDANFCSRLFFCWLNPLFKIGYKRRLEEDDMYSVLPEDRSQHLGEELQGYWDQEVLRAEKDAREPSLMKAILKCHWKSYLVLGIFILLEEGTRVVQPVFLGKMINYVENSNRTDSAALHEAYGYAAGLSAGMLVWAVVLLSLVLLSQSACGDEAESSRVPQDLPQGRFKFIEKQNGGFCFYLLLLRCSCGRVLRLSSSAMGKTTTGQIVNLLSNDVNRFDQGIVAVGQNCTALDHFSFNYSFINHEVRLLLSFRDKLGLVFAPQKPQPVREVNTSVITGESGNDVLALSVGGATAGNCSDCPALDGNRNIVSCWDGGSHFPSAVAKLLWDVVFITPNFTPILLQHRHCLPVKFLFAFPVQPPSSWADGRKFPRFCKVRGMNLASFFAVTIIMIFVTFTTNVAIDKLITASQVFVVVTLYEALRFTSTLYFPMAIKKVSEAIVSIRRIKNFLLLDEISQLNTQLPSGDKTIVHMKDFTAFWDKESETPTLQGLSFTVRPGELLAVVGPVGAGKSSLLHALLGELPPSQGQVSVHGRIVYVSQQPWVFSGTVRSNILFGKKYEEERYEKVIKACALEEDLQLLKENDLTKIGDRGTPLSEGQKARVSLARAVYQDADIYLLDDPLSAVDVGVSRHLFEQCIRQVLKEKITILVTHQLQYLKDASQILILRDGKVMEQGTFAEFSKFGIDFEDIILWEETEEAEPSPGPGTLTMISESSVQSQPSSRPSLKDVAPEDQDDFEHQTETIQVTFPLEGRSVGRVGFKSYENYFTAGDHWFIIIFLILVNIAAQVSYILQDWWLAYWANRQSTLYAMAYGKGRVVEIPDSGWYLTVHSVLTEGTILYGITRSLLIFYVLVNSSQTLHNKMLKSIFRAPMLFFDRNPIASSGAGSTQSRAQTVKGWLAITVHINLTPALPMMLLVYLQ
ncbi:hypothetical protein JEQ12_020656 [Ovis aries]|uniref:ABC transporter domain-containing protein n=1 Tax=Ovis aries TaxID=9940 RepID=A0A836CRS2_SHEEP|nr:hypothetical protein JEQ12_020656 [Ovis aries]